MQRYSEYHSDYCVRLLQLYGKREKFKRIYQEISNKMCKIKDGKIPDYEEIEKKKFKKQIFDIFKMKLR